MLVEKIFMPFNPAIPLLGNFLKEMTRQMPKDVYTRLCIA